MTRVATNAAIAKPIPVRSVMWQTYDDGGWAALDAAGFTKAKRYFQKANEYTTHFPAGDYHHGRTEAGIAWVEYRLTKQKAEQQQSVDPESLYRGTVIKAEHAIAKLKNAELNESDKQYLAKAYHLLGLLRIELCDGSSAKACLELAQAIYQQLQQRDAYFDVLHLLAKLFQCRRKFPEASRLFRKIVDEATDPERRFSALLDSANTLLWMGHVRDAWQMRIQWQRMEAQIKAMPEEERPEEEITRGQLLFARVHLLYGDYDEAEKLLQSTRQRLSAAEEKLAVCWSVYWVVLAELAKARGDLPKIGPALKELERIVHEIKLSKKGYGCLEIVAIDAACQICLLDTCAYETIRRECWCICGCWRVVFVPTTVFETKHKREPVNFAAILAEVANGIRAVEQFHRGRFETSDVLARGSISGIQGFLHTQSPLLIPLHLLRAELFQSRKESPTKVRQQLKTASAVVSAVGASTHPFAADRDRLLANWHVQLDENELAEDLYGRSLRHGASFRSETHPDHLWTQVQYQAARGAAAVGTEDEQEVLADSQHRLWPLVDSISAKVSCHDYRIAMARTAPLWLCLLGGHAASAHRGFTRASNHWVDRNTALNMADLPDTRQSDAILGMYVASIESGLDQESPDFATYRNLATREISKPMLAFELNRAGMLMMRADRFDGAEYCFKKSIELYPSQDYSGYRPTAADNLQTLAQRRKEPKACR